MSGYKPPSEGHALDRFREREREQGACACCGDFCYNVCECPRCVERSSRLEKEKKKSMSPLDALLTACRSLRSARDERNERGRKLHELARKARRTGESQRDALKRLDSHPRVWDVGDVTHEIIAALERYEENK